MKPYHTAQEDLFEELQRIDLILFYWVQKSRLERQEQKRDEFRGLYISEEEIDSLFTPQEELDRTKEHFSLEAIEEAIRGKTEKNQLKKAKSQERGISFPLDRLAQAFVLDGFDREVLLLSLAPELHLKYEKIYAYLQDNVTKKRPTVDLLLTLLCSDVWEKVGQRPRFSHSAPLVANQILQLYDEPGTLHSPLLAKWVKVDEGIIDFLLGEDTTDSRLIPFAQWVHPQRTIDSLSLEKSVRERLSDLGALIADGGNLSSGGLFLYFSGPPGVGKRLAAEALSRQAGCSLLTVDGSGLVGSETHPIPTINLILREAKLKNAIVYWANVDELFGHGERMQVWQRAIFDGVRSFSGVSIFGGGMAHPEFPLAGRPAIRMEFPPPSYELRKGLWREHLQDVGIELKSEDLSNLANRFRLTGGEIQEIVSTTLANRLHRQGVEAIPAGEILDKCRAHSRQRLMELAVKVNPTRSWEDIVLPQDQMESLHEICHYVKHQHLVLEGWGFGRKLVLSKGLNILFAGPSGTGKTMAAEVLAGELGLDLYRIDLATIVSKYIGETEKNLNRIFQEAEHSNAILFFDEADAIFGKRSEVRDSHDRYANIEISYLLQKMEAYDGIAILATNLRKNLDQAFLRRMHFTVEFPLPEEEDRLRIWQLCFPPTAPLGKDVDLRFLAQQFKIPGGNIKNIAVASAFHAAQNGGKIGMTNLIHATKREFQKMGKLIVESDFQPFRCLPISEGKVS